MESDWIESFARVVLSSSLRAVVLAGLVAVLLAAFRIRSGVVRHSAWAAVMVAMLLMPALTAVVPPVAIPLPLRMFLPAAAAPRAAAPSFEPAADLSAGSAPSEAGGPPERRDAAPRSAGRLPVGAQAPGAPGAGTARRDAWAWMGLTAYGAGVVFFFLRAIAGWSVMGRLIRSSSPCSENSLGDILRGRGTENISETTSGARDGLIRESPLVAAPLTAGLFSPCILLPAGWRRWPQDARRAVLAHESAHLGRRDHLWAFAAFVNRAVFWFHPLAWWLERALAAAAEEACDDAGAREVETPARYAEVLIDVAAAVRRTGRRVEWQAMGVDGTGRLGRRIDRIVNGECSREVPMKHKLALGVGVAAVILVVAACRVQPKAAPLEPSPEFTARMQQEKLTTAQFNAAKTMSLQQVAELEAGLQRNPEDREARGSLQVFYDHSDPAAIDWNQRVAARRRHVLWLIEHQPGGDAVREWRSIRQAEDPDGYAQARQLWLEQCAPANAAVPVLSNAAAFLESTDKPLAEQLLLRLDAIDPGGPTPRVNGRVYSSSWSSRLGGLYAGAVVGLIDPPWVFDVTFSPEEARSQFAVKARKALETTSNGGVLTGAAQLLAELGWRQLRSDVDLRGLSNAWLERAIQLDPQSTRLRAVQHRWRAFDMNMALAAKLKGVPHEQQAAVVSELPDADRMPVLPTRIAMEYMNAEFLEYTKEDPAAAASSWERTRKYAEDLLHLGETRPTDPERGAAIFSAHVGLAALSLRGTHDTSRALAHLQQALVAPPCDTLRYGSDMFWSRAAVGLLKRGERESVAKFLDEYAQLRVEGRQQLIDAAAAIRAGRMPDFYQRQVMGQ